MSWILPAYMLLWFISAILLAGLAWRHSRRHSFPVRLVCMLLVLAIAPVLAGLLLVRKVFS